MGPPSLSTEIRKLATAENSFKNRSIGLVGFIVPLENDRNYGGWIVSKVQSLFWRRVTSLRRGVVSTGGGTFQLEDTTICGGGVRFDLEEGV